MALTPFHIQFAEICKYTNNINTGQTYQAQNDRVKIMTLNSNSQMRKSAI